MVSKKNKEAKSTEGCSTGSADTTFTHNATYLRFHVSDAASQNLVLEHLLTMREFNSYI